MVPVVHRHRHTANLGRGGLARDHTTRRVDGEALWQVARAEEERVHLGVARRECQRHRLAHFVTLITGVAEGRREVGAERPHLDARHLGILDDVAKGHDQGIRRGGHDGAPHGADVGSNLADDVEALEDEGAVDRDVEEALARRADPVEDFGEIEAHLVGAPSDDGEAEIQRGCGRRIPAFTLKQTGRDQRGHRGIVDHELTGLEGVAGVREGAVRDPVAESVRPWERRPPRVDAVDEGRSAGVEDRPGEGRLSRRVDAVFDLDGHRAAPRGGRRPADHAAHRVDGQAGG